MTTNRPAINWLFVCSRERLVDAEYGMSAHTVSDPDFWLPAGVEIPPRKVSDIPATDFTQANSPYQGGYQGVGTFSNTVGRK
jgi:hypothetical protein